VNSSTRLVLLASMLVIFVATTGSGYLFLIQRNELSTQNLQLSENLERISNDNKTLKLDMSELDEALTQTRQEYNQLEQELASSVQDRDVLGLQIEALSRQNELLNAKLAEFQDSLTQALDEKGELAKRLDEVQREKGVELPRIVVYGDTPVEESQPNQVTEQNPVFVEDEPERAVSKALTARVVAVNKKHRFIVVDSGRREGMQEGMMFSILDDKESSVGTAQVVETRERVSALSIVQLGRRKKVKEGFLVVQEIQ
jgi:predicted nuclease with TOPRIM domain